ncbi:NAD(+) synthase [Methanosarcinales archaeon]|nr:MAG: NAD(+) synthase [Candidatus Omnitrophica bacterium 4484_213]RLG33246.1 MAG: NAD(+) synthase [Methanosarcinales archaeon]
MVDKIGVWLREQVQKAGKKGLILGLSGGVDSACVAALAKMAFPNNSLGLIMPCEQSSLDAEMAINLADKLDLTIKKIPLDKTYNTLLEILPPSEDKISKANLKPRLRMLTLYYFANIHNYLVVGTSNKSEITIGYYTKYGDGGVDLLPLGEFYKTEVKKIAEELGIPREIILRKPSAGLWAGQFDEDEIGISYFKLDEIIKAIESGNTGDINKSELDKVMKMIENSRHKNQPISVFPR